MKSLSTELNYLPKKLKNKNKNKNLLTYSNLKAFIFFRKKIWENKLIAVKFAILKSEPS